MSNSNKDCLDFSGYINVDGLYKQAVARFINHESKPIEKVNDIIKEIICENKIDDESLKKKLIDKIYEAYNLLNEASQSESESEEDVPAENDVDENYNKDDEDNTIWEDDVDGETESEDDSKNKDDEDNTIREDDVDGETESEDDDKNKDEKYKNFSANPLYSVIVPVFFEKKNKDGHTHFETSLKNYLNDYSEKWEEYAQGKSTEVPKSYLIITLGYAKNFLITAINNRSKEVSANEKNDHYLTSYLRIPYATIFGRIDSEDVYFALCDLLENGMTVKKKKGDKEKESVVKITKLQCAYFFISCYYSFIKDVYDKVHGKFVSEKKKAENEKKKAEKRIDNLINSSDTDINNDIKNELSRLEQDYYSSLCDSIKVAHSLFLKAINHKYEKLIIKEEDGEAIVKTEENGKPKVITVEVSMSELYKDGEYEIKEIIKANISQAVNDNINVIDEMTMFDIIYEFIMYEIANDESGFPDKGYLSKKLFGQSGSKTIKDPYKIINDPYKKVLSGLRNKLGYREEQNNSAKSFSSLTPAQLRDKYIDKNFVKRHFIFDVINAMESVGDMHKNFERDIRFYGVNKDSNYLKEAINNRINPYFSYEGVAFSEKDRQYEGEIYWAKLSFTKDAERKLESEYKDVVSIYIMPYRIVKEIVYEAHSNENVKFLEQIKSNPLYSDYDKATGNFHKLSNGIYQIVFVTSIGGPGWKEEAIEEKDKPKERLSKVKNSFYCPNVQNEKIRLPANRTGNEEYIKKLVNLALNRLGVLKETPSVADKEIEAEME